MDSQFFRHEDTLLYVAALTYFMPLVSIYTPLGFFMFSGGIERDQRAKKKIFSWIAKPVAAWIAVGAGSFADGTVAATETAVAVTSAVDWVADTALATGTGTVGTASEATGVDTRTLHNNAGILGARKLDSAWGVEKRLGWMETL